MRQPYFVPVFFNTSLRPIWKRFRYLAPTLCLISHTFQPQLFCCSPRFISAIFFAGGPSMLEGPALLSGGWGAMSANWEDWAVNWAGAIRGWAICCWLVWAETLRFLELGELGWGGGAEAARDDDNGSCCESEDWCGCTTEDIGREVDCEVDGGGVRWVIGTFEGPVCWGLVDLEVGDDLRNCHI